MVSFKSSSKYNEVYSNRCSPNSLYLDDELNKKIISQKNIAYGSKYRTGYAWILSNTKKINSSIKIKGQLGIWNINNIETNNM